MYNEQLKSEYIAFSRENNKHMEVYLDKAFRLLEEYEIKYGKDLSSFTTPEIIATYKCLLYSSLETLLTLNSQLKNYTSYCQYRNLVPDNQNHYMELDNDDMIKCINIRKLENGIITRESLIENIDKLYNPSEQFLLLALFEGVYGKQFEELVNLYSQNFKEYSIELCTGRKFDISKELYEYAMQSIAEYNYYPYKQTDDPRERNLTFKETDHRVLKNLYNVNTETTTAQRKNIYNKLIRIKSYIGLEAMTSKSLIESGRIHMIKQLMENGKYNSIEECIAANRNDIEYRYGYITSTTRWVLKYGKFV